MKGPVGGRHQEDAANRLLTATPDKKASKAREILAGIGTSFKKDQNSKAV